eukprot:303099-Pleurochrysis_carterae.AAC.2
MDATLRWHDAGSSLSEIAASQGFWLSSWPCLLFCTACRVAARRRPVPSLHIIPSVELTWRGGARGNLPWSIDGQGVRIFFMRSSQM